MYKYYVEDGLKAWHQLNHLKRAAELYSLEAMRPAMYRGGRGRGGPWRGGRFEASQAYTAWSSVSRLYNQDGQWGAVIHKQEYRFDSNIGNPFNAPVTMALTPTGLRDGHHIYYNHTKWAQLFCAKTQGHYDGNPAMNIRAVLKYASSGVRGAAGTGAAYGAGTATGLRMDNARVAPSAAKQQAPSSTARTGAAAGMHPSVLVGALGTATSTGTRWTGAEGSFAISEDDHHGKHLFHAHVQLHNHPLHKLFCRLHILRPDVSDAEIAHGDLLSVFAREVSQGAGPSGAGGAKKRARIDLTEERPQPRYANDTYLLRVLSALLEDESLQIQSADTLDGFMDAGHEMAASLSPYHGYELTPADLREARKQCHIGRVVDPTSYEVRFWRAVDSNIVADRYGVDVAVWPEDIDPDGDIQLPTEDEDDRPDFMPRPTPQPYFPSPSRQPPATAARPPLPPAHASATASTAKLPPSTGGRAWTGFADSFNDYDGYLGGLGAGTGTRVGPPSSPASHHEWGRGRVLGGPARGVLQSRLLQQAGAATAGKKRKRQDATAAAKPARAAAVLPHYDGGLYYGTAADEAHDDAYGAGGTGGEQGLTPSTMGWTAEDAADFNRWCQRFNDPSAVAKRRARPGRLLWHDMIEATNDYYQSSRFPKLQALARQGVHTMQRVFNELRQAGYVDSVG